MRSDPIAPTPEVVEMDSANRPASSPAQRLGSLSSVCPAMHQLFSQIEALALSEAAVLIQGETGTGKAALAAELHRHAGGLRRCAPLVSVVCTGMLAAQLEGTLQTLRCGPRPTRHPAGALAAARGGALVLHDVAALDLAAQAVLLRLLSEVPSLEIHRTRRSARVRIISLSQTRLAQLVRQGRFRPDLYHRLAAARLDMPPLRARRADLPLLASEALQRLAVLHGHALPGLDEEARMLLTGYPWPGNIRELQNVLEQASLRALGNSSITAADFAGLLDPVEAPAQIGIPIGVTLAEAEREVILRTLAAHEGKRKATADTLQISRRTLYEKLARYRRNSS